MLLHQKIGAFETQIGGEGISVSSTRSRITFKPIVLRDMARTFLNPDGRKHMLTLERHLVPAPDIADDGWAGAPRLPNYLVHPRPPGGQATAAGMPRCPPGKRAPTLPTRCQHLAEAPHRAHLREPEGPAELPAGRIQFWNFKCGR